MIILYVEWYYIFILILDKVIRIVLGVLSYVYWIDWVVTSYIGCIGMNGINVFKVIINKFGWFNVLVVDIVNGRLWWGDVYLDYIEWVF